MHASHDFAIAALRDLGAASGISVELQYRAASMRSRRCGAANAMSPASTCPRAASAR
jgi:hypothetical protein